MPFVYPTDVELREIESDFVAEETTTDPIFADFPIVDSNSHTLAWETYDATTGLQQVRGLNGQPGRVQRKGIKGYLAEPAVFGEVLELDEKYMTEARPIGQLTGKINLDAEILRLHRQLVARDVTRKRCSIWTLLTTGRYSVLGSAGVTATDSFPIQSATAAVNWGTPATATPLADLRAVQLLSRGTSCSFDQGAKCFMNRVTANQLLAVTNAADLAGKRTPGYGSVLSIADLNTLLLGEGLPQIIVMDDGYYDDDGAWQQFIGNGVAVIVGRRPGGQKLGEYRQTRNANNPDMAPGVYVKVVDSKDGSAPVPRTIAVHRGHNGGPVIYYPNGVVVLNTTAA